jgi:predicted nucleic acid-binding protein
MTILPFDEQLARAGNVLAEPDLQIASIALHHALPLVSHNQRHFDRVLRLKLLDWIATSL